MEEKKEKKKEEHGMDLDRFPCHSVHYFLCVIVGTKKSEERPDQEVKGLAIGWWHSSFWASASPYAK